MDRTLTVIELRDYAAQVRSAGFDGLEWRLPDDSAQLQSEIPDLDTRIGAIAWRCELIDTASAAELLTRQLKTAAAYGAKVLNLRIAPSRKDYDGGFACYQDGLDFGYELLRVVRFEAEAAGVAIGLEAVTGGCFLSPIELRELLDAVCSPSVGACLDVRRISVIGSPTDWIRTLHRRIRSVRLAHADGFGKPDIEADRIRSEPLVEVLDAVSIDCPMILSREAKTGLAPKDKSDSVRDPSVSDDSVCQRAV